MKWPWVNRLVLEEAEARATAAETRLADAKEQIDYLRQEASEIRDQLTRVVRVQTGMAETPRKPREGLKAIPRDLLDFINKYGDPRLRKQIRDAAFRRHAQGEEWPSIRLDIMGEEATNGRQEGESA